MSEPKGLLRLSKNFRAVLLIVVTAAVIYLIILNVHTFGNILLVLLGFGAVVLVHEFGHFIVAKLSGIKVESFSIFFPPVLAGIQRTENGYRVRILPDFFPKEEGSDKGELSFTIGKAAKAGETEYRIGLIPFGGFVKMLGQEDVGETKTSDDPRSYANKPVSVRMGVLAAGVLFNAISAIIVFMIVFLIGIKLQPAVVGGVVPGSSAALAGLKAGDEVIEINGKGDGLDFSDILMAAALSDANEEIKLKVRREDKSIKEFSIVAKQSRGEQMRFFGIEKPIDLGISQLCDADADQLRARTGLAPGDRIKSVNGVEVETFWRLEEVVQDALVPTLNVLAERTKGTGKGELIEAKIPLGLSPADGEVKSESDLSYICSMVPRLQVSIVASETISGVGEVTSPLVKMGIKKEEVGTEQGLRKGDIILAAGNVENPTYKELRDVTEEYEDRELPIKVLRTDANGVEKSLEVTVIPRRAPGADRVMIGIGVVLDAEHAVVAKTISVEGGPAALDIPRGARITAVDGVGVSNFFDIIREIRRDAGKRVTIDYRVGEKAADDVVLDLRTDRNFITVKSSFAEFVPFEDLKRLYKASGPVDAIRMGYEKTIMFIVQTYVTLKRLIGGLVSPKNLMGPVGIISLSYRIVAQQPFVYYVYFLGLISACIAVFNFLPLPPLDGGLFVLLVVEKIKGSALSGRLQGIIAYVGWALIGVLFLYVTFNDIVRSFFS